MFKIGDKVELITHGQNHLKGEQYVIEEIWNSGFNFWYRQEAGVPDGELEESLKLISSSDSCGTTIMSTISNLIKKITRGEPEKTFVEVGFLSDCEEITSDGKDALINILWDKNKTELKELADKIKVLKAEEK